ncbi:MAG TPA: NifU family protein [Gaiellales bacterium]|jgi:Fe/S biogenesis protein NfuA
MSISITPEAIAKVLEVRSREHDPDDLALWVEIVGIAGSAYEYDMAFLRRDEIDETDVVVEHDGLTIVVPRLDGPALEQATIALDGRLGGGLVIDNPKAPAPTSPALALPPLPQLEGSVSERVDQVLTLQINPAIATHGGSAELVAAEGDTAYVRLGGGCQGCGMAAMTLKRGVESAIRAAVPEIERVIDVTDHAAGASPYYQPAS